MPIFRDETVRVRSFRLSRRSFVRGVSAGAVAAGTLNFRDLLGLRADELRAEGRAMILLWMQGGPSQFEMFDPKPGTDHGGPTAAISTAVSGIRIAQGWENTAAAMKDIALIRSMTNKEGQHQRATYQLHTGYLPTGSVRHPSLAANIAKQLADPMHTLPAVVSIGQSQGAGFLGVDFEPFIVQNPSDPPQNVEVPVRGSRYDRRLALLNEIETEFAARGAKTAVENHRKLYSKASKFVLSPDVKAFDISDEPRERLAKYGDSDFGRGCLLARRLVEAGVTFVEVEMRGWDTHDDNFTRTSNLAAQVDPAFAALVADLKERGRLERTLVVLMGEFGRTPRINPRTGRDHYPRVFNMALAGGGVQGGQVIGSSTDDGTAVKDAPVTVPDLFCSVCHSMKVDPRIERLSPQGRPLKIVDGGSVVENLFA